MSRAVKLFGVGRSGRGQKQTNITLWDHVQLKQDLMSKPDMVIRRFAACQVECLAQLDAYHQICEENPQAARRIEAIAALFGIPIRLQEDLTQNGRNGCPSSLRREDAKDSNADAQ